uniref:Uncharacterized protein n=1 Tax=Quercus lobata TaxID=97700 RepID=A0A7N2KQZ9_QUELO
MEALNEFYCCFLDIFISSVSCQCSIHLQVVERSPESSSTEAKQPNVEIAASGKLNLLGRMLEEINKQSLKALILYEEIGCSGSCIGGILDDFLLQKIGSDSYDHVGRDVIPAKRVAALNKFNAEHKNDWTPMKSLKALERIKPDSQPEQIKIFRLYSPFIVEENILCFAREKKNLKAYRSASTMSEKSPMKDIEQLLQNREGTGTINLSIILKVQVKGSYYMSSQMSIKLLEISQEDYAELCNYWNKLLRGKHNTEVVTEKVIKKCKVDKGSSVPFEQVFQDECTPISTAAQLQVRYSPANKMQNVAASVSHRDEVVAATIEPVMQIQQLSAAGSHSGSNANLCSAGGIEHQLSSGGHTSNQLAQTPTHRTMSSHPDLLYIELQIIHKEIEEELKNHKEVEEQLLFEFGKELEKMRTQYVNKAQELH